MSKRRAITEEQNVHREWYDDARKMTMERLPEFLRHLHEDYEHDYGTVCHMMAASALATSWAMNGTEGARGGITGFQAGAVMWQFIVEWEQERGPMRLVRYDHMLYPQYEYNFEKTIPPETWEYLQKEARKKLEENKDALAASAVVEHWRSIANGVVPFGYVVRK